MDPTNRQQIFWIVLIIICLYIFSKFRTKSQKGTTSTANGDLLVFANDGKKIKTMKNPTITSELKDYGNNKRMTALVDDIYEGNHDKIIEKIKESGVIMVFKHNKLIVKQGKDIIPADPGDEVPLGTYIYLLLLMYKSKEKPKPDVKIYLNNDVKFTLEHDIAQLFKLLKK